MISNLLHSLLTRQTGLNQRGTDAFNFIEFVNFDQMSSQLTLYLQQLPDGDLNVSFANLRTLVLNNYTRAYYNVIAAITTGELSQLEFLIIYANNFSSTSDRLNEQQFADIQHLYKLLQIIYGTWNNANRNLEIYIQGLLFDPRDTFYNRGFDLKQIELIFKYRFGYVLLLCRFVSIISNYLSDVLPTFFGCHADHKWFFKHYRNFWITVLKP